MSDNQCIGNIDDNLEETHEVHKEDSASLAGHSKEPLNKYGCVYCHNPLCDPVKLKCGHQICKCCLASHLKTRLNLRFSPNCPKCDASETWSDKQTYLSDDCKDNISKVKYEVNVHKDHKKQFCPMCREVTDVRSNITNSSKSAKCNNGHEFCILCNKPKHTGPCKKANTFWRIWNDQFTRRCPNCRDIIQVWMYQDQSVIECQRCHTKLEPNKFKHLSPLGHILVYVFLVFIIPVYVGMWVYKKLKAKDTSHTHERRNECLAVLTAIGIILCIIGVVALMASGGTLIVAPFAYCMAIARHVNQCREEERNLKEHELHPLEIERLRAENGDESSTDEENQEGNKRSYGTIPNN
ncbi:unnamed protein product [Moneuplotes crassus]|uniref:RING-type domain-containing protein n=1 Tax=Euplotes crassus TaxID=5936 RepID=A0AAD2CV98_EUPCR|nr:unnamed protein product [Moneuplotes crassus]CAI2372634.1 unnamed protein product [Moneuplotes crassus]